MSGSIRSLMLALALGATPALAADEYFTGEARVIDGDTIEIGFQVIRLIGIDAPEDGQMCLDLAGHEWDCAGSATEKLTDLIDGRNVTCGVQKYDRYDRALGLCKVVGGSTTLNGELVRSGFALAFRRYSDKFVPEEAEARRVQNGMWTGQFLEPWEWRKQNRSR